MTTNRLGGILRHLRRAVRPAGEEQSDACLLDLYLRHRDEAAFEALVLRHGPMVLGVCRRVLANDEDSEDAFQAVFLILVRNAASVRKRGSIGSWLYGVAHRTALEARRAMATRRAKEAKVVPRTEVSASGGDDLREVLDQELAGLPERYRAAIVLCDLEGKGRQEAARELGCPEGTVASRLARGRSLLAKRLARRGLATGATAALSREAASACVPAALVSSTVKAATLYGAGGAAGVVSLNVSSLVERVVRIMLAVKLRAMTAVLLLVGVVGSGTGWLYYHRAAAGQPEAAGVAAQPGEADEQAKLRQEVKRLQEDLRRALERTAALEARLEGMAKKPGEVLFRGKPAAYWIKALEDRDPTYRKEAVQALGGIAVVDRAVLPVLAGGMKDEDEEVAREAGLQLTRGGKAAVPYLIEALKGQDQRLRDRALAATRFLGQDAAGAVPTVLDILKGGHPDERRAAAATLGHIGPPAKAAVPALLELLLKGRDNKDRRVAAFALGQIGRDARAAVTVLIALLKEPDQETREEAAKALGGIGPEAKEAVQPLIRMLKGKESGDCWYAAVALGGIGPDARPAVPALLEALRRWDGHGKLPGIVFDALEKIDPEAAARVKKP